MRERMSGNLCRCGAYNGIVEAIESVESGVPMKPFSYRAGHRRHPRAARLAEHPNAKFLGGGTNLVDLCAGSRRPTGWST